MCDGWVKWVICCDLVTTMGGMAKPLIQMVPLYMMEVVVGGDVVIVAFGGRRWGGLELGVDYCTQSSHN